MNPIVLPARARFHKDKVRELADRLGGSVEWAVQVVVPQRHRLENAAKDVAEIVWALERAGVADRSLHYGLDHERLSDYPFAEYLRRTRDAADELTETVGVQARGLYGLGAGRFGEDQVEEVVEACSLTWLTPTYYVWDVRRGYRDPQHDVDLARRQRMPLAPFYCGQQTRVAGHPLVPEELLTDQALDARDKGVRAGFVWCDLNQDDAVSGVLNVVNAMRRAEGGQSQ